MALAEFLKQRSGAIAVKFAIMAPLFMLAVAGAVEYSRAAGARAQLQQAVDTATLSATRMLALEPSATDADLRALIDAHLAAAEVSQDATFACTDVDMSVDRAEVRVALTVNCAVSTLLPIGFEEIALERSAASDFSFDALDVSFMIDVSGSMNGSRLTDLKAALNAAVDIFLNDSRSDVRMAFAPYSTSLNAGDFAEEATGVDLRFRNGAYFDGGGGERIDCVTERSQDGDGAFDDTPPSQAPLGRRSGACNDAEILALTDNEAMLRGRIASLTAGGRTAGHLGIAWSWYLISPRWSGFWPAASRPLPAGEGRKAIIIMTDGMFNQRYETENGDSSAQSRLLCQNIRAAGVLVFSVGFQAPDSVKGVLRDCATTPNYFFDSADGDALIAAYKAIAEELTTHNLVQ